MKGVYAAFFRLEEEKVIEVGALGERYFDPGLYVYVGSAQNSIESRLKRHFSRTENKHWHVDYFSSVAEPVYWLAFPLKSSFECVLSRCAASVGEGVEEFGCSDCSCGSHLYRLKSKGFLKEGA